MLSVVGRAHEGRPIFATDDDKRFFVERLRRVFDGRAAALYAYALPINHYHLLVRVRDVAPGILFRRLNIPVARRERRLRGDHGAVFQGRYYSSRCEREGSVLAALSYVLGNPVHHNVVPSAEALESYPWTALSRRGAGGRRSSPSSAGRWTRPCRGAARPGSLRPAAEDRHRAGAAEVRVEDPSRTGK